MVSDTDAVLDLDGQTALFPPNDPETDEVPATVYVVATVYADDPHAHIEGVFREEADAREVEGNCAERFTPPHPVAWGVYEEEVR